MKSSTHKKSLIYRELSDGGAMSDFRWNSGGKFNGSEWSGDKLPTDAELVMNCLSAYLDARLVTHLSVGTPSKPFTGTYYQVGSLSCFEVSYQLLANDFNQLSSVSLLMTSSTALANQGLFELTLR